MDAVHIAPPDIRLVFALCLLTIAVEGCRKNDHAGAPPGQQATSAAAATSRPPSSGPETSNAGVQRSYELLNDKRAVVRLTLDNQNDLWTVSIEVASGQYRREISANDIFGMKEQDVLKMFRQSVRWAGDYLIVGVYGGGGNAWRCDLDHIFWYHTGSLRYLGAVAGGTKYDGRFFEDIYDKFETNDLTCHVGAPGFTMLLENKHGKLVVNLPETWKRCRAEYELRRKELDNIILARSNYRASVPPDVFDKAIEPAFANLVLTKYCQRTREYNLTVEQTKRLFKDIAFLAKETAQVKAGELMAQPNE